MISTAPLAPITAISARGQAKLTSPRRCLDAHHVVGAAVGLARDHGDLRHRALGVGVQQLGAVLDDAAVLLAVPGMKPGTSTKVTIGMLKASQKRTKRAALIAALDVEAAGQHQRLVGDDAHRSAPSMRAEADHDVLRVVGLQLEEVAVVDHLRRSAPSCRRACSGCRAPACRATSRARSAGSSLGRTRRLLAVVERQVVEEAAQHQQRLDVVLEGEVGHAALAWCA